MKENKYASLKLFLLRSKLLLIFGAVFIVGSIIFVPKIFAELQPVKSIEIFSEKLSYQNREPGAWKVTKSAKWTGKGEAEITFDLDTILQERPVKGKDILLAFDTSFLFEPEEYDKIKRYTVDFIKDFVNDDNRLGLISYGRESQIVSDFTSDKDFLIEKINSFSATGEYSSWYRALIDVDNILKEYEYLQDRECIVLLLTNHSAVIDSPNEVGQYNYLKSQYPFVTINGIGCSVLEVLCNRLESVSDNQYDGYNVDLKNILMEATFIPSLYQEFTIGDKINTESFYIVNEKVVKINQGKVALDSKNQKVTWSMDDLKSGSNAQMTLKVKLKDEFIGKAGIYSTNTEENINSKLEGIIENVSSAKTPVLKDDYQVKYDGNAPDNCSVSGVPSDKHYSVYETVPLSNIVPECEGYQFNGWKLVTEGVKSINDDYFVMPESDVTIKGTWSRLKIKKSMEGKVKENLTLYQQVEADASDSVELAKKYTGDTSTFRGDKDIYYYEKGSNNNVVFANYCWKIVRTTDTGGVKLLYNGVPAANGSCNNSGTDSQLTAEQMGTDSATINFNSLGDSLANVGYMYNEVYTNSSKSFYSYSSPNELFDSFSSKDMGSGSDYTFYYGDSLDTSGFFSKLKNPKSYEWSANYKNLVGKYTAFSKDTDEVWGIVKIIKTTPTKVYYIGESESEFFKLATNFKTNADGTYTLINPITVAKASWIDNYSKYQNYYLCKKGVNTTCSDMYQNTCGKEKQAGGYKISFGMRFGNSFTFSGGKYTLKNAKTIWDLNDNNAFSNYHYTCLTKSDTCSEIFYVTKHSTMNDRFDYLILKNGDSIESVLDKMLKINKNDSNIKKAIDTWYSKSMTKYTNYLEDTVWCNDRSVSSLGAYNPNGGSTATFSIVDKLHYRSYVNKSDLTCPNKTDSFTVNASNGNGALTYPVGMITNQEYFLSSVDTNSFSWTLSPSYESNVYETPYSSSSGSGVQPSVSLKSGISYSAGDGSVDNPYVVLAE